MRIKKKKLYNCWVRSGKNATAGWPWPELRMRNLLTLPVSSDCTLLTTPTVGSVFKDAALRKQCVVETVWIMFGTEPHLWPQYRLSRYWWPGAEIYAFCGCTRQALYISSLLIIAATYRFGVVSLLQSLLVPLVWGPVSDFTRKLPRIGTNNGAFLQGQHWLELYSSINARGLPHFSF